ncbi:Kinesin-like protein KIF23 [Geodia barretti]|uniref:riboflavin kinase n=1 Tax=Geodia barretti TaxID=519541 RepID=A0AA35QZK1_GEOBA|nr:Kinesin-like protein KIF23 [Geodia barretti]
MTGFVSQEKEKFERLATHMKTQQRDLLAKSAQIQQVKELIRNSPHLARTPLRDTNQTITMAKTTATPPAAFAKGNAPPIKGKGRKRSASENWLEHVPSSTVENGGILQPQLKKKRTVSTPKPKDFQSKRVGRYVLQHQEEDSDGDIKTALYKGDIQPTRGGGTSVTFTGVETHRHSSQCILSLPKVTRRSNRLAVRGGNPTRPALSSGGGQSPDHSISSLSSTSVSSFMDHSARGGGGMEGDGEEDSWTDVETRETHILHVFPEDFYGAELRVCVAAFIREEKSFPSLECLKKEIHKDIETARERLTQPAMATLANKLVSWTADSA